MVGSQGAGGQICRASDVGPGRRGPGQREGAGSGSQLQRRGAPSWTWSHQCHSGQNWHPGLAYHVLSNIHSCRGGVESLLLLRGGRVKKPQASQEKVVQHPSLNLLSGIHAPFLYHHVPVHTQSLSSLPSPAAHCLEGPHVAKCLLLHPHPHQTSLGLSAGKAVRRRLCQAHLFVLGYINCSFLPPGPLAASPWH